MKPLLIALAILAAISCRTNKNSRTVERVSLRDSVRISDSVRVRDSINLVRRDSVVLREGSKTGFEVQPCDSGRVKPFRYHFTKGNVVVSVAMAADGRLRTDIDNSAELAYREKILSEYREYFKDKYQHYAVYHHYEVYRHYAVTKTRTVWPWWLWALLVGAGLVLVLRIAGPVGSIIRHWTK